MDPAAGGTQIFKIYVNSSKDQLSSGPAYYEAILPKLCTSFSNIWNQSGWRRNAATAVARNSFPPRVNKNPPPPLNMDASDQAADKKFIDWTPEN